MKCWSLAMAAAVGLALPGMSLAADPRFPDWPCNQIKVPEISVAAAVAERIRHQIAGEPFTMRNGSTAIAVTISIGIATLAGAEDGAVGGAATEACGKSSSFNSTSSSGSSPNGLAG